MIEIISVFLQQNIVIGPVILYKCDCENCENKTEMATMVYW